MPRNGTRNAYRGIIIIGGGFVTPRVHSQLTYPGTRARVVPFHQGGWFPNGRGLSRCLT